MKTRARTAIVAAPSSASISNLGFLKVGSAVPKLSVGNPAFNAAETVLLMALAEARGIKVLVFPELGLTGYTCADLFQQKALLQGSLDALRQVRDASRQFSGIVFVGMPLSVDNKLFNCAVAVSRGAVLGIVPKTFLPNYKEFYEKRWFVASTALGETNYVRLFDEVVPIGVDLLFTASDLPELVIGAEICEDAWAPITPGHLAALNNALVVVNLSASNELVGKMAYRRELVSSRASHNICAYIYTSSGVHESTTDVVFSGHSMICENGSFLAENQRFERESLLLSADIDLERLSQERLTNPTFADCQTQFAAMRIFRQVAFQVGEVSRPEKLQRFVDAHPFVPKDKATLDLRCNEIFNIQTAALAKRLDRMRQRSGKAPKVTIGVSGGLDSTLALIAAVRTFDMLGMPRSNIHGYTMPGYGTTARTKGNAHALMQHLGITPHEVDIRKACLAQMQEEGHKPFGIDLDGLDVESFTAKLVAAQDNAVATGTELKDLYFENVQARMRTKILMDNGFVIGTGDVSELAKGWCTYNGDHMSMYNVNCSVPKTLVKFLVHWAALKVFEGATRVTLVDIVETEISPELLPAGKDGKIAQKTEEKVGPYELVDFFLYYMVRFGMTPEKMLYLARHAKFNQDYSEADLLKWLRDFLVRFFDNQFKRSCVPDGPKVGSISLSPRGDWRMPSDADGDIWLGFVDGEIAKLPPVVKNGAVTKPGGAETAAAIETKGLTVMNPTPKVFRVLGRVDYQNCFRFNGTLAVAAFVDSVIDVANRVTNEIRWDWIWDSQDWHPADHVNYYTMHPGKKPFDKAIICGMEQTLWTVHGTQNTEDAEFHPNLDRSKVNFTVRKGQDPRVDSNSAFYDNGIDAPAEIKALYPFIGQSTGLAEEMFAQADKAGADEIELTLEGVTFDICLAMSALHAARLEYKGKRIKVRVVEDASPSFGDPEATKAAFEAAGIELVQSADILPLVKV
ncbi:MAG: NAD(+) synthase [Candidatus Melainabacteria bacterium]|nr:NAD(+) synthase [Candidatus Melainabacteria bacterium]